MKKLLHKFRKQEEVQSSSRITSDTVAHHRERILAGGRRFKYPIQYTRHKLVINAIIISVVALVIVVAVGWWQLYPSQNTSDFMYRITKVLPLPVASVDGQSVLYSDYLMKYLSSVHYLEKIEQVNLKTDDGKRQIEYIKQQSMKDAIADAYAQKMAKSLNISVSESDIQASYKIQRQSSSGEVSEQTSDAVNLDYYGWSPSDYHHVTEQKLLRQKVTYAMDKEALSTADNISTTFKNDSSTDLKTLAATVSSQKSIKVGYAVSGMVLKTNRDGGLAAEASKLTKGQVSLAFKSTSGDGYYFVKLIDSNDTQVSYEYIKVPLTAFDSALSAVIKSGKVNKYISIPDSTK
ncbi:MAG: SurA N-terminal domain-containing protein [Candidatus Saccharibacteria bacterium]